MHRCKKCNAPITITPQQRKTIRAFKAKYFYVTQNDLARLFGVSQMRISEIIRADKTKGGL